MMIGNWKCDHRDGNELALYLTPDEVRHFSRDGVPLPLGCSIDFAACSLSLGFGSGASGTEANPNEQRAWPEHTRRYRLEAVELNFMPRWSICEVEYRVEGDFLTVELDSDVWAWPWPHYKQCAGYDARRQAQFDYCLRRLFARAPNTRRLPGRLFDLVGAECVNHAKHGQHLRFLNDKLRTVLPSDLLQAYGALETPTSREEGPHATAPGCARAA
jgi:hypothetical protein